MNKTQQRIKIAEACGWHDVQTNPLTKGERSPQLAGRHCPTGPLEGIPDYLNDLNAMHSAIQTLSLEQLHEYVEFLRKSDGPVSRNHCPLTWIYAHIATAEQRAEAFLLTLGLWEEGKTVTANLYPDDKTWEDAK